MKRILSLLLPFILIFLTGCERIAEPNDLLYAVALGVDKAEEGYRFTIQYAKVFEINSGAESGESGGEIVENITVEAPSIYSAVDIANHLVSKRFILSHLRLAVFSEEAAREGIGSFVEVMSRNRDIRPDIYIAAARGSSEEYLKNIKPATEVNPSKYYELMYENIYSEYIPKTTNEEMYKSIAGGGRDMAAAMAGISEKESRIIKSGYEYGIKSMEGEERGGVMGMGIFSKDKLVMVCPSEEVKLYNILMDKFEYGYITFYNSRNPDEPITLRLEKRRDVDFDIKAAESIKAGVNIYMEAEFSGLPLDYDQEKYIEEYENEINGYLEKAAEEFLNKVYLQNCDILDIKGKVKRGFLTDKGYKEYNIEERAIEFDVKAEIKIRRAGLTVRE